MVHACVLSLISVIVLEHLHPVAPKPSSNARVARPITDRSQNFDPDGRLKRTSNALADRHSGQTGSVDWGVIPCGLEEAMAVRIALRRSREDSARPTDGSVRRDSIASAHRALGSSGAGSSRSRPEHLSFPITGRADYESHRERAARRGKERIRAAEARIAAEMAAAEAADAAARVAAEEEAIRARIVKKRQRRNTRALAP